MAHSTKILGLCIGLVLACAPLLADAPPPPGDPDWSCPTGTDLDAYLRAQEEIARTPGAPGRSAEAAAPVVSFHDGVLVVEDSGLVLRGDRIFDLPMESIEFAPSGDGYAVSQIPSAWVPVSGMAVFTGETGWRAEQIALGAFPFPFGGQDRTTFWVTSTNMISFEPPVEPVKVGLCSDGCFFAEGHLLLDRLPRISPLQHGSFKYGRNAYIQGDASHAVITWQYDDPAYLDVQVVLFPDGRIRMNYNAVVAIEHGAPVVVTGNEGFWSDLRLGGEVVDPEGDVPMGPPDGPVLDFLGATARQVGTSELLQVEIELAAAPSWNQEEARLYYRMELRDRASDPEPLSSVLLQWQGGRFYYVTEPVKVEGSTLRMNLRLWDLPLAGNSLHLRFTTSRGDGPIEQADSMELTATFAPPDGRMMLDLSEDLPVTLGDRPVYEAFTLPALQVWEVLKAVSPFFEDPPAIEMFPTFQNLQTDLYFFGGGYHAGGNNGVDGIGYGTSTTPRSPGVLHLNNLYLYTEEEGAMQVLNHEMGHRWLYDFTIEEDGTPTRSLNPSDGHPAGWVHTPAVQPVYKPADYSVMGGSTWMDLGDGTFRSPAEAKGWGNGFSWHELYLMGLVAPEEVDDWWYIRNSNPPLPDRYWAPNDIVVSGERVPVSVDQIIAAEGPRFPAYPDAVQHFLNPMVLVVRPGEFTTEEIDTINDMCDTWQARFNTAAGFRGTLRCRFHPPTVSISSPAPGLTVSAGESVDFVGAATDADGDDVELRWSFPGVAPDAVGEGPHPVTFGATGSFTASLMGVDETGMLADGDDSVQITVECPVTPPAAAVENLRLSLEGEEIRFTWNDLASPPTDYVVLGGDSANGSFLPAGAAASGTPGLLLPAPGGVAFYKVAARQDPGCLGPY